MVPLKPTYQPSHPSKEQVRAWLLERVQSHTPPPDQDEVRRQLGFGLVAPVADVDRD